jgi:hypothetical protein
MKWLKTYENFKNDTVIKEEFLGKLFGKIKDNLSLKFSKQFGNSKKVDKLIEKYKEKVIELMEEKSKALKALGEYIKGFTDNDEEPDETKIKELKTNLDKADAAYSKKLESTKKVFDLKFNNILEEEDNKKIKFYINLKKLELERDLIEREQKIIFDEIGLSKEDIKDNKIFKEYTDNLNKNAKTNIKNTKKQQEELSKKGDNKEVDNDFDFEKAANDKNYSGPFKNETFSVGDELKVFITKTSQDVPSYDKEKDDYEGTTVYVVSKKKGDQKDELRISYDKDGETSFTISKGKVISKL